MAQRTVLVVPREPFVKATRVEGVTALETANLRIVGEVIQTYGAARGQLRAVRSPQLEDLPKRIGHLKRSWVLLLLTRKPIIEMLTLNMAFELVLARLQPLLLHVCVAAD
jgi:hypothetical protein